ncbi:hypothetical protein G3I19_03515 [Streptomyces sp. SID10853]|uniref:hypothetical protein n=1 Tax=Streptomyces sp. SID10853 TaxID=2706028 RepID=UPI0013C16805|nr:hypothetical protein [Streptomyces sp. SID10853]NDZ77606.1 hypothetical protein [Streptomyces sp. SID10853]
MLVSSAFTLTVAMWCAGPAYADGTPGSSTATAPTGPHGGTGDQSVNASVGTSRIKITQVKGSGGGKGGTLAPIDSNWKPPACWYEPVYTPEQLKKASEAGNVDYVGIHESWSDSIFIDHYDKGEPEDNFDLNANSDSVADGYKNYNIGKGGYFWRSVAPDESDPDSWQCGRIMFWQPAGQVPKIPHAPTPKMLAEYAYNKVKVPETKIELKPQTKSTVNLPTWVWLDKGTFKDVAVRAELPNTGLWAETTAKPVSLHLDPGTDDADTFPASGTCTFNKDGSIGTPYKSGDASQNPPCGINYLHATDGNPYQLKASITWKISWKGTGGAGGDLPDGTFQTTQDMNVQEIQTINR